MGQESLKSSGNKEFISSGRWKCDKSPSGAHHWLIHRQEMKCRYCDFIKPVDTDGFGLAKPENK